MNRFLIGASSVPGRPSALCWQTKQWAKSTVSTFSFCSVEREVTWLNWFHQWFGLHWDGSCEGMNVVLCKCLLEGDCFSGAIAELREERNVFSGVEWDARGKSRRQCPVAGGSNVKLRNWKVRVSGIQRARGASMRWQEPCKPTGFWSLFWEHREWLKDCN